MVKAYELMILLRPDSKTEGTAIVKKLLGEKITVKEVSSWGKKSLSYPIKKQTEAVYWLAQLEAESLRSGEIEKQTKVNEEVLRFLLTAKS